jgi:Uma2 family endonuclease
MALAVCRETHAAWIVDIDSKRIECHRPEGGEYELALAWEGDEALAHPDWPGLTIDLAPLWR